jgi:hypothetical protein
LRNQTPDGKDNLVGMAANRRIKLLWTKLKPSVAVLNPIHNQSKSHQFPADCSIAEARLDAA